MTRPWTRSRTRRRRPAFTLVEMMVVIGILLLLMSLLVAVFPRFLEKADVDRTKATMRLLETALADWETEADRKPTLGEDAGKLKFTIQSDTPHAFMIAELLQTLRRNAAVEAILAQIPASDLVTIDSDGETPEWVSDISADDPDPGAVLVAARFNSGTYDGWLTVIDAWENPIRVVHPGRLPSKGAGDGDPPYDDIMNRDRTIFVKAGPESGLEQYYGVAANRRVCFVSAGPDGEFGNLHMDETESNLSPSDREDVARAEDNIYSYQIVTDRPQPDFEGNPTG